MCLSGNARGIIVAAMKGSSGARRRKAKTWHEVALQEGHVRLTAQNFAELSERDEMSENRLRTGQNRFLLHRSYSEKCD
jgi:hypothetical protein